LAPSEILQTVQLARIARHLAAVQLADERNDAGADGGAGRHVGGRLARDGLPASGTIGAVQVEPRRDGPDGRQFRHRRRRAHN